MFGWDAVSILNTGVTGFALLMLALGYRLTHQVQLRLLELSHQDRDADAWDRTVQRQLANTRYFMATSLLFFIGGTSMMLYEDLGEAEITLHVIPVDLTMQEEDRWLPEVRHQGSPIQLDDDGWSTVVVHDRHNVSIENHAIAPSLAKIMVANRRLSIELAEGRDDAGI